MSRAGNCLGLNTIFVMPWIQIHLTTNKQTAPLAELLLDGLGAVSVTMEDAEDEPMLEPAPGETPLWSQTKVTGLFPMTSDQEHIIARIREELETSSIFDISIEDLADQAWERAWLDDFHPMQFGQNLWIAPEGQTPDDPRAITVKLDPGLAFGTGTHPTTALCLNWLDQAEIAGKTVVDFGCGSGILSIAALLLGAKNVIAIDHDPQALEATQSNALKNHVDDRLAILHSEQPLEVTADITIANILASTLIELEPVFARHTISGGAIVLSGILEEQADTVMTAFNGNFTIHPPKIKDGWVLLDGHHR
jgi:ribosomal protein L11 methyltransferase